LRHCSFVYTVVVVRKTEQLNVRATREEIERVKTLAARQRKTISDVVWEAVEREEQRLERRETS